MVWVVVCCRTGHRFSFPWQVRLPFLWICDWTKEGSSLQLVLHVRIQDNQLNWPPASGPLIDLHLQTQTKPPVAHPSLDTRPTASPAKNCEYKQMRTHPVYPYGHFLTHFKTVSYPSAYAILEAPVLLLPLFFPHWNEPAARGVLTSRRAFAIFAVFCWVLPFG